MTIPGKLTPTQYRATLHVPKFLNNGTPVEESFVVALEDTLVARFGAFTRTGCTGVWKSDDGTVYTDKQCLYHIDVCHENDIHGLRYVADEVREQLAQECVYVTVQQISTYLV